VRQLLSDGRIGPEGQRAYYEVCTDPRVLELVEAMAFAASRKNWSLRFRQIDGWASASYPTFTDDVFEAEFGKKLFLKVSLLLCQSVAQFCDRAEREGMI
jgi:hypothetical protein